MFPTSFVVLGLIASAFATPFTTSPVASTSWPAGQPATVSWMDDGKAPSLKDFGPSKVSIYVGNALQQTSLQTLSDNVDVSTTTSIQFTPDASIGPNSNEYFIRFESLSLKDASDSKYPALAFSAKFTLSGMTGVFTADVKKQIEGQSTAPIASPSSTSSAGSSGSVTASATARQSLAASASKSSAAPSESASNAAVSLTSSSSMMVVGAFVVALAAFF